MLVIARRAQENLVIPSIQATVRVVAIRSASVRLGVEAPVDVGVYREELYDRLVASGQALAAPASTDRHQHKVRNHLNNVTLALGMLRRQLGTGRTAAAQALLERAADECVALRQQLDALLGGEADCAAPVSLGGGI